MPGIRFGARRGVLLKGAGVGSAALYAFTNATFTPGTQTGSTGPDLTTARAGLTGTGVDAWKNNTSYFNTSSGIQLWTVPITGTYTIDAYGAQGGDDGNAGRGGLGARVKGDYVLTQGETIRILVGQKADMTKNGAGGATHVYRNAGDALPLIVAAGGGGWGNSCGNASGASSSTTAATVYGAGYAAGTGGNGGAAGTGTGWGGGGGGWLTNGTDGGTYGGIAYAPRNGGAGGNVFTCSGGFGGFGGGGGGGCNGGGGGGGYNGGGTCGGGGSYNAGANQTNTSATKTNDGSVTITLL